MTKRPGKRLRSGFTTGTAATAAAKAALTHLLTGRMPVHIDVQLPDDTVLQIAIQEYHVAGPDTTRCMVIKDAGDDPDVTHGALIGAAVQIRRDVKAFAVDIIGGPGVGVVTKPGLEVPPGQAAITAGPVRMMKLAVAQVCAAQGIQAGVRIEVFVPQGEVLAKHTLNSRLGIVGGISILGTTGVVRPLSHEAYVKTIAAALSVARSAGLDRVVLATGRRSERFAQQYWPRIPQEGFVQIGDYFAHSLKMAAEKGFCDITMAVFFGKAVKMAQGVGHTHASSARLTLAHLSRWALAAGCDPDLARRVHEANTARHAFDFIKTECPALIDVVARKTVRSAEGFAGKGARVQVVIFDFGGGICVKQGDEPCLP